MPEIQQSNVVDNYLGAMYGAQDRVQKRDDAQYQRQRQMTQDTQQSKLFDQNSQINALNMAMTKHKNLVNLLGRSSDEASFQQSLQTAALPVEQGGLGLDPSQLSGMSFAKDYQRLKNEAGVTGEELDLAYKRAQIGAQNASTQHSLAATQALQNKPVGNRDPNTGVRTPPQGTQNKDYAELQKISAQADAASNIAATLQGIKPQLDEQLTGKGFGWRRNVAGFMSMLPDFGIEKSLTGENKTDKYMNTYDAIEQASKTIGIDTLQKMGGSDTEMELKTAIQTTVNADLTPKENWRRFQNQIKASDILSKKAQLASEWVNKFGSLSYAAPDGTTWQGFWPAYQKSEWAKHQKQMQDTLARDAASRNGAGGKPQQSHVDAADAIIFGRNQ